MEPGRTKKLWYGDLLVGYIHGPVLSDGRTWEGDFESALGSQDGALASRIIDYIEFSESWTEQSLDDSEPTDPDDWQRYEDVTGSQLWRTEDEDGTLRKTDAPTFYRKPERWLSWFYAPD